MLAACGVPTSCTPRFGWPRGRRRAGASSPTSTQDAADVVALRDRLRRPDELASQLEADVVSTRSRPRGAFWPPPTGCSAPGTSWRPSTTRPTCCSTTCAAASPPTGTSSTRRRAGVHHPAEPGDRHPLCRGAGADCPTGCGPTTSSRSRDASGDVDLWRLASEYLPLTFSRRHGDPSRPWNKFQIVLRDEHGAPRLDYQGNWRDIFQNWEALAWSFPEYVESMVTVFLDATTADGYNPYRISRAGVDWEVPSRTTRGRTSGTGATTRSSTCSSCWRRPSASTRAAWTHWSTGPCSPTPTCRTASRPTPRRWPTRTTPSRSTPTATPSSAREWPARALTAGWSTRPTATWCG